jgi:hypothetical protein
VTVTLLENTATRVCRICGVEKPLTDFQTDESRRVCKSCRNHRRVLLAINERARNKEIYGNVRNPVQAEKARISALLHWNRTRSANIEEFGSPLSPIQKERQRICREKTRTNNQSLYGFALTPAQRLVARIRATNKRTQNVELFGATRSPDERKHVNRANREHYREKRQKIIALLGGCCTCCGETRFKLLTIDHKNGGGRGLGVAGGDLVYEIGKRMKQGLTLDSYRILCWNCNASIGFFGYCPHNHANSDNLPQSTAHRACYLRQYKKERKLELIKAYGGKCEFCGDANSEFLTIDHIHNDGRRHRKEIGYIGGADFYAWLKRNNYPRDRYQLLCFNCNCSKGNNGGTKDGIFVQETQGW